MIICDNLYESNERITFANLTIGKKYYPVNSLDDSDKLVSIIDDSGSCCWYPKNNFVEVSKIRNSKIDIILKILYLVLRNYIFYHDFLVVHLKY